MMEYNSRSRFGCTAPIDGVGLPVWATPACFKECRLRTSRCYDDLLDKTECYIIVVIPLNELLDFLTKTKWCYYANIMLLLSLS